MCIFHGQPYEVIDVPEDEPIVAWRRFVVWRGGYISRWTLTCSRSSSFIPEGTLISPFQGTRWWRFLKRRIPDEDVVGEGSKGFYSYASPKAARRGARLHTVMVKVAIYGRVVSYRGKMSSADGWFSDKPYYLPAGYRSSGMRILEVFLNKPPAETAYSHYKETYDTIERSLRSRYEGKDIVIRDAK